MTTWEGPSDEPLSDVEHLTVSTRDPSEVADRLAGWLAPRVSEARDLALDDLHSPESTGMSSETILFTARWIDAGSSEPVERDLVARVAPAPDGMPVFPRYDMEGQFRLLRLVAAESDAPVPEALWYEEDPEVLGSPFFVMEQVRGVTPPDLMPYTFGDSWVHEGGPEDLATMQRSVVETMAAVHRINPQDHDLTFLAQPPEDRSTLEHHVDLWDAYHRWVVGDRPSPLLARAFTWLRETLPRPDDPGPACLSWGDARIGNMLFEDYRVVGVLDWEMAGIAPPEVDLGWLVFMHRFFHEIAVDLDLPGMPDFLAIDDVAAAYADVTGRPPADMTWFETYAAVRHGVIMRRVTERAVHFGEATEPDDVDDLIFHRATLAQMVS